MIDIRIVMDSVNDSKAVLTGKRKTLLLISEKYLRQIEQAEQKINPKTDSRYVQRINEQREFIDAMIGFIQETENCTNHLSTIIGDFMEFYEAELLKGGRICHDVQFWKNQAVRMDASKRRIIKAFSNVLNQDQRSELFKLLTE